MATVLKSWSFIAFLVVVGATFALCPTGALAQTKMSPGDEVRPLFATPDDIADGKKLAQNACVTCHGAGRD